MTILADGDHAARYEADPVTAWAEDVAAGRIVAGPYVRDAAARHLRDLVDGPGRGLVWDVETAKKVIGWFARNLRLNGGQFEGRPFVLHPSQAFRVGSLFGWKRAADGLRRFRRFYDEEGKGNGKSPMLGGIGLYLMVADGEARAEIYSAAAKKDQARILFQDAVAMVDQSPRLAAKIGQQGANPVWQLSYRGKDGGTRFFKPIANEAKSGGQSGPRPHGALCDEVHEHPSRDTIDMLERGFKFRRQPLLCMATNSGSDRKSICWEEHQHAIRVAAGIVEDDTTFAFVCSLDEGDDWENDPSCWAKANPLLDVTISSDWLAAQVELAKKIPGKRNGIARLHFCEWTQAQTAAIRREAWVACRKPVDLAAMVAGGYPCFGGLDLSQTRDFSALTLVWLLDATRDAERFAAHTWFWTPKDTLADRAAADQTPYDDWVRAGHIEAVPGERLKYAWLADAIARINAEFAPQSIGCDQYGLERLQEHLADIGAVIPAEIHPQGFQKRILGKDPQAPEGQQEIYLWMPDSINKLEAAIYEERIGISHNPLLDSMAASVVYAENRTGHRMFDKPNAYGRIDGMVSLAMATGVALCRAVDEGRKQRQNSYFRSLVGA
ncbi:MAG: terminase large subunit [Paracoccus sp. (in: a-proteobacteria)]|uniref:terminase large subunit n=1 Tax=Paracoccus sp. TaxID=267 RepID=UPI0026DFA714|nr:terminase large subunit [Paracoccus sp. (in: a-proteobacteria)]MDO5621927.1 terminase large subunit [Paracoccus sp. (in: a-proteobacteria)]